MANDQKMVAQMLDLSRSIEKLSATVRKNTEATDSLSELQEARDNTKEQKAPDLKPIIDSLAGLKDIKPLTDELKKLDFVGLSKTLKDIGNQLSGSKQSVEKINPLKGFDVNKIIGAFQEGGVAKKDGNYLVGENGPEVVKLKPESAVIPLNVKDLMEGLKKIPELSKAIEGGTIKIYGDEKNPSVFTSPNITDLKNMVNLDKLERTYDNKLDRAEEASSLKVPGGGDVNEINSQYNAVRSLSDLASRTVRTKHDELSMEQSKIHKALGDMSSDQLKKMDKKWDELLDELPEGFRNDISVATAHNMALSQLLSEPKKAGDKNNPIQNNEQKPKSKEELKAAEGKETQSKEELKAAEGKETLTVLKAPAEIGNAVKEAATSPQGKNGESAQAPKQESNIQGFLKKVSGGAKDKVTGLGKTAIGGLEGTALSAVNSQVGGLLKSVSPSLGPAASLIPGNTGQLISGLEKKGIGKITGLFSKKKKPETEKLAEAKNTITPLSTPSRTSEDKANKNVEKLTAGISDAINTKSNTLVETRKPQTSSESNSEATKSVMSKPSISQNESKHQEGMAESLNDMKALLSQMCAILSGTLEVTMLDSPFRPDSRKV